LEGWTYGPVRDDKKKQTPDMVPYKDLSDGEKEYDRATAMRSIKLLKKLGYDVVKVQETELYKEMIERIRNNKEQYHCSNCGGFIFKHQVFCEHCGHKLDKTDWEG
jgi:rubrerythrin